jgi:hypothetical protein
MLVEEFLAPMHITQRELAAAIHVPTSEENSRNWSPFSSTADQSGLMSQALLAASAGNQVDAVSPKAKKRPPNAVARDLLQPPNGSHYAYD